MKPSWCVGPRVVRVMVVSYVKALGSFCKTNTEHHLPSSFRAFGHARGIPSIGAPHAAMYWPLLGFATSSLPTGICTYTYPNKGQEKCLLVGLRLITPKIPFEFAIKSIVVQKVRRCDLQAMCRVCLVVAFWNDVGLSHSFNTGADENVPSWGANPIIRRKNTI